MKSGTLTRRRALIAAIAFGLATFGSQALAQQAPSDDATPKEEDASKLEAITVTGTRISNPNVVSPTPVSVLTAADIKAVGAINIGDVLTRLPQLATTFTMGNSGGAQIGTVGLGLQDLRNLGPQRTLVLVNGRRFVSSSTDTAGVDTNLIPADWIERVEIITGGASAVYGADAVSGVVNFILKKNYQGADLHVQVGDSEHGGFGERFISATAGSNFANDRGNFAISIENSHQDEVMFSDRYGNQSFSSVLTPGTPYTRTLLPDAGSWGTLEGGQFSLGPGVDQRYTFDPDGNVRLQRFDGIYDTSRCQDCDHLNVNQVLQLQPKYDRTSLNTTASFDLNPNHRLYFEGTYSVSKTMSKFQPAFGNNAISPDNAYVTPELAALMPSDGIVVNRFDVDTGLRSEDHTRQTGRIVLGLNGRFGDDWEYDASGNYGVSQDEVAFLNNRLYERFFASIDAVRDPTTGQIVCRSTIDPTHVDPNMGAPISDFGREGCIPTSIFGAGAVNAAARNWFNATTYRHNRLQETVFSGTLTNNNLFSMPTGAGSVSLVLGAEYRKEKMDQTNDPLDISGVTFNNAIPSFEGEYDVKEGFLELGVPILADKPFFKDLSVDAAVRESSYDTIGHTETWKYGLNWAFDDNVRMRGTMSYAVRAPNINELFSGQSQNFFTVTDPCTASRLGNGPNEAVRTANCAALGVPPTIVDPSASVNGVSGSNPNLQPENAKSYSFGFVLTPQFLDGFLFSADYWNIKLKNAIAAVDAQDIVNQCVDAVGGINNTYCASITRDPNTHALTFIKSFNLNLAGINTSGIDFAANYTHDLGPGRLRLDLNVTRVIGYTSFPFQDHPDQSENDNGTDGFPVWKAVLSARYSMDRWRFDWNIRYFDSMLRTGISNESYAANPTQVTPIKEGSRVYNDVRAAYGVEKDGWQVYGGVNNVFDRKPPVNIFGTTFGGGLYDAIGRSYYVGFNYNF